MEDEANKENYINKSYKFRIYPTDGRHEHCEQGYQRNRHDAHSEQHQGMDLSGLRGEAR